MRLKVLIQIFAVTFLLSWQQVEAGGSFLTRHESPNIIYIMLDELGYYEPSFMGNKYLETPNMDRMAKELYKGETHAQDVIFEQSIKFIKANKDKKFFCYLPWTPPHGLWGIKSGREHPGFCLRRQRR